MSAITAFTFLMISGFCFQSVYGKCRSQNRDMIKFGHFFRSADEIFCDRFEDIDDCFQFTTLTLYKFTTKTAPSEINYLCYSFREILILEIEHTELELMKPNTLSGFDNIREIHLSHNKIKKIGNKLFSNKKKLEILDLSYNNISFIGNNSFQGDKILKYLHLNDNKIAHLNMSMFNGLTALQVLTLTNNPITKVSPTTYDVSPLVSVFLRIKAVHLDNMNLELSNYDLISSKLGRDISELYLCQNRIASINILTFSSFHMLKYLDLSYNLIKWIGSNTFDNNKNLEELHLNNNKIEDLFNSLFSHLLKLRYLDLSNNPIIRIDELGIGKLPNLRELKIINLNLRDDNLKFFKNMKITKLDISHNNVSSMSDLRSSTDPVYIEIIDLSYNKVKKFETLARIQDSIKKFSMSNNELTEIGGRIFSNCTCLAYLDLAYNSIEFIAENAFELDTKLENLTLQGNDLKEISSTLFKDLTNLKYLDLSDNEISVLLAGTFEDLQNLQILNLSYNRVQTLGKFHLCPLKNLQDLYLQSNQLRDVEGLQCLKYLQEIYLSENPWRCKNLFDIFEILDSFGHDFNVHNDSKVSFVHHVRHISCDHQNINAFAVGNDTGEHTVPKSILSDTSMETNSSQKLILVTENLVFLIILCVLCAYWSMKMRAKKLAKQVDADLLDFTL